MSLEKSARCWLRITESESHMTVTGFTAWSTCYRASVCNACTARYCYSKSVLVSVCLSSAGSFG